MGRSKKLLLFVGLVSLVSLALAVTAVPLSAQTIVNGSFETGDYTGWTLLETDQLISPRDPTFGTWGIVPSGSTISRDDEVFDFLTVY